MDIGLAAIFRTVELDLDVAPASSSGCEWDLEISTVVSACLLESEEAPCLDLDEGGACMQKTGRKQTTHRREWVRH